MGRKKWTEGTLQEEALKYQTRNEFSNFSNSAYTTARKKGLLDQICGHMGGNVSWTKDMLQEEALKFGT